MDWLFDIWTAAFKASSEPSNGCLVDACKCMSRPYQQHERPAQ